ncbi:hypothetical protein ACJX0J_036353, partial [Zea mays]
ESYMEIRLRNLTHECLVGSLQDLSYMYQGSSMRLNDNEDMTTALTSELFWIKKLFWIKVKSLIGGWSLFFRFWQIRLIQLELLKKICIGDLSALEAINCGVS